MTGLYTFKFRGSNMNNDQLVDISEQEYDTTITLYSIDSWYDELGGWSDNDIHTMSTRQVPPLGTPLDEANYIAEWVMDELLNSRARVCFDILDMPEGDSYNYWLRLDQNTDDYELCLYTSPDDVAENDEYYDHWQPLYRFVIEN
jgi:hypothetical protein